MPTVARAPGKLVVLGEYSVLAGGPALVIAVDRHAVATLGPSPDASCRLVTRAEGSNERRFACEDGCGVAIVDLVTRHWPSGTAAPWSGRLDSSQLFSSGRKIGLGSSAAALVAWAGAWSAFNGLKLGGPAELMSLHRSWQGGLGSGLDVAASVRGGVIAFRTDEEKVPEIVSVPLPYGVRFVGVFAGQTAATRGFIERFLAWRVAEPESSESWLKDMRGIAEAGIAAAKANDSATFLSAIADYGVGLTALGEAIGAEIMTAMHRAIARAAAQHGLIYKVSGAGGGDVGVGYTTDPQAIDAFSAALPPGCTALDLGIDDRGLVIEDRRE